VARHGPESRPGLPRNHGPASTGIRNIGTHRAVYVTFKALGRISKGADAVEIGTQVAQGNYKDAGGTGINSAVGAVVTIGATALAVYPPAALGLGALAALGANQIDLGARLIDPPDANLSPGQQQTYWNLERSF